MKIQNKTSTEKYFEIIKFSVITNIKFERSRVNLRDNIVI